MGGAAVWLVLTLAAIVRAAGGSVPHSLEIVCATVAAPVALAAAGHALSGLWRGPALLSFSRNESDGCTPDEAAYVRLVAQLRGTMGGAGFLYPGRLLLPAAAWAAASAEGAALVASDLEAWVFALLAGFGVLVAVAALLYPARAFYYHEATGGTAIVSPPSAARRLKRRAAVAYASAGGVRGVAASPAPTPSSLPEATLAQRAGPGGGRS